MQRSHSQGWSLNHYLSRFDADEVEVLRKIFNELSAKASYAGVDKLTFIQFFSFPGLWGDRVFDYFATKGNYAGNIAFIDYTEFLAGLSECCRGSKVAKIQVLFQIFDLSGCGSVESSDLVSMLSNINLGRLQLYLMCPEEIVSDATVVPFEQIEEYAKRVCETKNPPINENKNMDFTMVNWYTEKDNNSSRSSSAVVPEINDSDDEMNCVTCEPTEDQTIGNMPKPQQVGIPFMEGIGKLEAKNKSVQEIVDEIIEIYGDHHTSAMNFSQFKAWMERCPGLMSFFNEGLHEDLWGLQGKALYRNTQSAAFKFSVMHYGRNLRNKNLHQGSLNDQTQISRKGTISFEKYVQLLNHFSLKQADLLLANDNAQGLFVGCPSCEAPLLYCPICSKSIFLKYHKDVGPVMECSFCIDSTKSAFAACWLCHYEFADTNYIQRTPPRTTCEGYLFKIGHISRRWCRRFYVLIENILYYYKRETDLKPRGCVFLNGSFVNVLNTGAERKIAKRDNKSRASKTFTVNGQVVVQPEHRRGMMTERWGFSISYKLPSGGVETREFYLDNKAERDMWIERCCMGTGQRQIEKVYQFHEKIGAGRFSVVFRATHIVTGKEVAIKVIRKKETTPLDRLLLKTELRVTSILNHKFIIKIIDRFDSQTTVCIVMEYVRGGELYERLQKKRRLSELEVHKVISQLCETLIYMHNCGVVHRDLKPENILVTNEDEGDFDIRVTDFGLSCIRGPNELMTQPCGTLPYVAPEVFTGLGYDKGCDIWAVGVIMFLLLRGKLPFNPSKGSTGANVYKLKFDSQWNNISKAAQDLLKALLIVNPNERVTLEEAVKAAWITNPTGVIPVSGEAPTRLALLPSTKNVYEDE